MDLGKRLTEETFAIILKAEVLVSQVSRKLYAIMIHLGHAVSFGLPSYYHARISLSIQGDQDMELAAAFYLSSATLNALVNSWKTIRVASSSLCVG